MSEQERANEPLDNLETALMGIHPELSALHESTDDPCSVLIQMLFETRIIEVSGWDDGIVAIKQTWTTCHDDEMLDLDDESWAILDVVRAWQKSVHASSEGVPS